MRKWDSYPHNSWEFHEHVVESKYNTNPNKLVAQTFATPLYQAFLEYDNLFVNNSLGNLSARRFPPVSSLKNSEGNVMSEADIKTSFRNLYDYSSKPFAILEYSLTTTPDNRIITTCPICTCGKIESLDHIIPRADKPEFSTHPFNLIPSCTKCNGKKNSNWKDRGEYKYINPYLDDLSDKQYLLLKPVWIDNNPIITYEIFQGPQVSDALYAKIKNHFEDLDLCKRFLDCSSEELDKISIDVKSASSSDSEYQIRATLLRSGRALLEKEGKSYWLGLLKIKCATDRHLFEYLLR